MTSLETWHGTYSGYTHHKCRCVACTRASREYQRTRRQRLGPLAPDDPRHGTCNAYNSYRCRCAPCANAKATYDKATYDAHKNGRR